MKADCEKIYSRETTPWEQDGKGKRLKEYYQTSRDKLYILVNRLDGSIAEVGCGLGYSLNYITGQKEGDFTGYDISPVAIGRAKKLFPLLKFETLDIRKQKVKADIIILSELLWYVVDDLKSVFSNCQCKYLIVNQSFLPEQKYDKDIVDGYNGLTKIVLSNGYTIINSSYNYKDRPLMNGLMLCIK